MGGTVTLAFPGLYAPQSAGPGMRRVTVLAVCVVLALFVVAFAVCARCCEPQRYFVRRAGACLSSSAKPVDAPSAVSCLRALGEAIHDLSVVGRSGLSVYINKKVGVIVGTARVDPHPAVDGLAKCRALPLGVFRRRARPREDGRHQWRFFWGVSTLCSPLEGPLNVV